jgi:hypothetical protein
MVDKQNINARFIDKYGQGTTSVNVSNPPGGKSTISLGWGDSNTNDYKKNDTYSVYKNPKSNNIITNNVDNTNSSSINTKSFKNLGKNNDITGKIGSQPLQEKTSVRVRQVPGGQSQIKFG